MHSTIRLFFLKFVTLITITFFTLGSMAEQEAVLVNVTKIGLFEFHDEFTAIGQCKSENSKTYYAKTKGVINSMSIIQGNNVSAGDILITIDEGIAKADKAKAEAAFATAKIEHNRNLSLLQKKIVNNELVDKSKVVLESATADLILAQNKYEDMVIKAPYNGYVGVINARVGDDVKPGDYLFSLIAHGDKTVFVELPEIMNSKINQSSKFYATGNDGLKVEGNMIAVSNYLNDNGTITAKISFPPDSKLIHGSYVEIKIIFNQHKALSVPEKTMLKNNNGNFIYKMNNDNIAKQIYIKTGSRTENMIEVLTGDIKIDDSIITSGLTKIYDGALVKIIEDSNQTVTPPSN